MSAQIRTRFAGPVREAAVRERLLLAGTVANERQLHGIINLDDRFQAASSEDRVSGHDPEASFAASGGMPESRHCAEFSQIDT